VRLGSPIPFRQTQSTFFIRTHSKLLSVAAMWVSNQNRSPMIIRAADTQPQLQPALLRLSAIISQYFTSGWDCPAHVLSLAHLNRAKERSVKQ
jgi:hypothetical protein